MRLLVTGGCGFIGSCFVRLALARGAEVVNLDKLTYAGNPANVAEVADHPRYSFVRADIADAVAVRGAIEGADAVVNLAAESHVDRSILEPADFIRTDVVGTAVLLDAAREVPASRRRTACRRARCSACPSTPGRSGSGPCRAERCGQWGVGDQWPWSESRGPGKPGRPS